MDLYEIEDTSDWLGTPSRLEAVKTYASMLEEDIQDLKHQLKAAKENVWATFPIGWNPRLCCSAEHAQAQFKYAGDQPFERYYTASTAQLAIFHEAAKRQPASQPTSSTVLNI